MGLTETHKKESEDSMKVKPGNSKLSVIEKLKKGMAARNYNQHFMSQMHPYMPESSGDSYYPAMGKRTYSMSTEEEQFYPTPFHGPS